MRKSLLALVCMALSSAAFAVTVNWQWKDSQITGWADTSSCYMVYSQHEMSWQEVLSAAKTQNTNSNVVKGSIYLIGHTATVGFDMPVSNGSYYLYVALFNNQDPSSADQYAVAQAGDSAVSISADGGISIPGPDGDPLPVNFLDPTWMAGNYKAAPEPTALALLALGVAGAALRRRIR